MSNSWRLIEDPPRSGSFNMAVDLHLLQQFQPGDSPIFRLYSWERPTLSLGRNEKIDQGINLDFCREEQIPLIRRMTGGKAVLHQSDLTYSIIGELGDPQFGEGVHETYRSLAEGFLLFFEKLGLKPQLVDASSSRDLEPHLCFTVPSVAEILVEGRKLIGSAQRIRGSASQGRFFLQHGSIPLDDPVPRMLSIFRNAEEQDLRSKMHSLETLNIYPTKTKKTLASLLKDCFAECFQLNWTQSPGFRPDDEEIQIAVKHFPDLSSDPETIKRPKLSALNPLVPEKMFEGA